MNDGDDIRRDDPMLAAEYVLGLLKGDELQTAHEKIANDEQFRWRRDWWNNWFAPWADEIVPMEPAPDLWHRIAAEIHSGRNTGGQD